MRKVNLEAWRLHLFMGDAGEGGGVQEMGTGLNEIK